MKKYLSLILICAMILTMFAGCSKPKDEKTPDDKENIEAEEKESANNDNTDKNNDTNKDEANNEDEKETATGNDVLYLIDSITFNGLSSDDNAYYYKSFTYNSDNYCIQAYTNSSTNNSSVQTTEYDEKGSVIKRIENGYTTTFSNIYNENGDIIKCIYNSDPDTYSTYEYDTNGNIKKDIYVTTDRTNTTTYEYDKNGRLLNETYNSSDSSDEYLHKLTYTYDEEGKMTEYVYYLSNNEIRWQVFYTYNDNGTLATKKQYGYSSEPDYAEYKYSYDENNCLTNISITIPTYNATGNYTITYTKANDSLKTTDKQYDFQKDLLDTMFYEAGPVFNVVL